MDAEELREIAEEKVNVILAKWMGDPHELAVQLFVAGFGFGVGQMSSEVIGRLSILKSQMQARKILRVQPSVVSIPPHIHSP